MNAVMPAVLAIPLARPELLLITLVQRVLITNVVMLARLVLIVARVVILHLTPVVVMIPQRQNAALPVIGLRLVVLIAVRPGQNIIPVLMPVLRNVGLVVTTVPTAVLRGLHLIPVLMRAPQNVVQAVIIAQTVVLLVQPHLLVQEVTRLNK